MPEKIEHIDAIARKLKRDVLFVMFHHPRKAGAEDLVDAWKLDARFDWKTSPVRQQLIAWHTARDIGWKSCGHFADTNVMISYRGQIYIDLVYNSEDPEYCALAQYPEYPDGSMRLSSNTL